MSRAFDLVFWRPLALIAIATVVRLTRLPLHKDEMADAWSTYRHQWTDDEGEAA